MPPAGKIVPIEKIVRSILAMIQKMINGKAHGEIVISFRDGHIILVREQKTHLPENLIES